MALLAAFVAIAVAFRFVAFGFAPGTATLTFLAGLLILAGTTWIRLNFIAAFVFGHDERAINKIRCGLNRGG